MNFVKAIFNRSRVTKTGCVLRVKVTADDIKNGMPGNAANCPIALAAGRAVDKLFGSANVTVKPRVWPQSVSWETSQIRFDAGGNRFTLAAFDQSVETFVMTFDTQHKVSPITLTLTFKRQ